jgi:UDP-N-acetyl-D-mannosaminuronate dehydrogenase
LLKDSNIVILATDWPEYKEIDFSSYIPSMAENNFYDARNCLNKEEMSKLFNFDNLGA